MLVTVFVPRPIHYVRHHAEVGFGAMKILLRRMGSATGNVISVNTSLNAAKVGLPNRERQVFEREYVESD